MFIDRVLPNCQRAFSNKIKPNSSDYSGIQLPNRHRSFSNKITPNCQQLFSNKITPNG
jgi:hypothetical protein